MSNLEVFPLAFARIEEDGKLLSYAADLATADRICAALQIKDQVDELKDRHAVELRKKDSERRRAVVDAESKLAIRLIRELAPAKDVRVLLMKHGILAGSDLFQRIKFEIPEEDRDFVMLHSHRPNHKANKP